MTPPLAVGVTADSLRDRLAAMAGKPLPGRRTCRVARVLAEIRDADPDVAEVLEVGIADENITQGQLSVLLGELGFEVTAGTIGHHRRGIRGDKGRNACRCKKG